jgi:dimethylhistidine N-methyltransferase
LAADVLRGLSAGEKNLPCKYFYDEAGSELFERICQLPEYYPTRTEIGILERSAGEMADVLGRGCLLIEYGSGSSCKTRLLLDRLAEPAGYVPVDIAGTQLQASAAALGERYPHLEIRPLCADFTCPLQVPWMERPVGRRVVYFPGSTIGNLVPAEAIELLQRTAQLCGHGGGLLLGADLKKEPWVLTQAYNDSQGVTAAFNFNLLLRINRELRTQFDVGHFWHHAFYNPRESRIEMHLVSREDQRVEVLGQDCCFAEGESIRTEYSYKYAPRDLQNLAEASGFRVEREWSDERGYFAVQYWAVNDGAADRPSNNGW